MTMTMNQVTDAFEEAGFDVLECGSFNMPESNTGKVFQVGCCDHMKEATLYACEGPEFKEVSTHELSLEGIHALVQSALYQVVEF